MLIRYLNRTRIGIVLILLTAGRVCSQEQRPPWRFVPAASLPVATAAHSAATLKDNTILITGGYGMMFQKLPMVTKLARIFDPNTESWRLARGQLNIARFNHGSIRLPGGGVLLVGGIDQSKAPLPSIELFDPDTEQFTLLPAMQIPRTNPALNLLPGGRVLITGNSKIAEIIEPNQTAATGYQTRVLTARTHTFHQDHAAVSLSDGSVLLIGGRTTHIERFDPCSESFSMTHTRLPGVFDDMTAVRVGDEEVFIAGGQDVATMISINNTWIYDTKQNQLFESPPLFFPDKTEITSASDMKSTDLFPKTHMNIGKYIFICGGEFDPGKGKQDINLDTAYIYLSESRRLIFVGPMRSAHDEFSIAALPEKDGMLRVLIIGGHGANDSISAECEIFEINREKLLEMP